MKKIFSVIVLVLCTFFVFAACAPAPDLELAITGEVSKIEKDGDVTKLYVDSLGTEEGSLYPQLVATVNADTKVNYGEKSATFQENMIVVGTGVEVWLTRDAPVTMSLPPMANAQEITIVSLQGLEAPFL
ncbi:MAG: hypothetical protein RSA86_04825 [Christensenellaceae bacterium]